MRTTIAIEDDVFAAAMQISRVSGERIGKVVSNLVRLGLSPQSEVKIVQDGRFPAFAPPEGTAVMDPDLIQRVLDEEGF